MNRKMYCLYIFALSFLILSISVIPSLSKPESYFHSEEKWIRFIHEYKKAEYAYDIIQSRDGCYVVLTYSTIGDLSSGRGDIHLICLDECGSIKWENIFGGGKDDIPHHVEQVSDGGFIIAGGTKSYGAGGGDVWLIKTDENGNEIWNKTYGGRYVDEGFYVEQTADGGYIISGCTMSYSWEHYVPIGWIIKTDENGNEIWNKTIGGRATFVQPWRVHQTDEGGYLIVATLYHLVHPNPNEWVTTCSDIWLIKTDENGNEIWNKTLNYSVYDIAFDTALTRDGGCVMAGVKWNLTGSENYPIMHVIKVDGKGDVEWREAFKGKENPYHPETFGGTIQLTSDGGYMVSGSNTGPYTIVDNIFLTSPPERLWLIKLDENGKEEWNRSYQVMGCDLTGPFTIVKQTMDGGYIATGTLYGFRTSVYRPTGTLVVKTDSMGRTRELQLKLCMFMHLQWFVKQWIYLKWGYEIKSMPSQSHVWHSLIPDRLAPPIHFYR